MENNYGNGLYQDGVFYFTNPGLFKTKNKQGELTTDWAVLWNNKEHIFEGKTTSPLIIANEPPENIQTIRRKFAFKYAQAWFHQTKRYKDLVKSGGLIPATYDEDSEFLNVIQACLTPLPKSQAKVRELPRESEDNFKGSKAIRPGQDLNQMFKDYEPPVLGKME